MTTAYGMESLIVHMDQCYRALGGPILSRLLREFSLSEEQRQDIHDFAWQLVETIRAQGGEKGVFTELMHKYDLTSAEGLALMSLAESLLRVPDGATANDLIEDKLKGIDWKATKRDEDSWIVKLSGTGLNMAQSLLSLRSDTENGVAGLLGSMSAPIIRQGVKEVIKAMAQTFVMAETIEEGARIADRQTAYPVKYSFDMLGESARTDEMAKKYFESYSHAIEVLGKHAVALNPYNNPGISIKLSALHPRYEYRKEELMMSELVPKLRHLLEQAKRENLNVTIDAEEADRLTLSLKVIEKSLSTDLLAGWPGFGLAVQAYQKRASFVIDWVVQLAHQYDQTIGVRLVKGAYLDTEIKRAQVEGQSGYPVFTRKSATDMSYLMCAQKLLRHKDRLHPQFATHNAYTASAILKMDPSQTGYEFQRLYGMGKSLYETLWDDFEVRVPCRIYAPVGENKDLLAYLVRRLLENGANTSFVHKISQKDVGIEDLVKDPFQTFLEGDRVGHRAIPLPQNIFAPGRQNSKGVDFACIPVRESFLKEVQENLKTGEFHVTPLLNGGRIDGEAHQVTNPAFYQKKLGSVKYNTPDTLQEALRAAHLFWPQWRETPIADRASVLERAADLFEAEMATWVGLCTVEAGKTMDDGVAEVREAVDFLRYYAVQARTHFEKPLTMPGPTGEMNQLYMEGRGVFLCISPWNFPLAIFIGQIAAALVTGNTVIAKPADRTPIIAYRAVQKLFEAGLPMGALQLIFAPGRMVSDVLVSNPLIAGVAFTGSTETAFQINQTLAARRGPISSLIAETGGINAMIVDSTALPEQVADAVIRSSFQSAGQRCSALRLLCVQNDVADTVIEMIIGGMKQLTVGDPMQLATDLGPVISREARGTFEAYIEEVTAKGATILYKVPKAPTHQMGFYFMPHLLEVGRVKDVDREIFGPILHVVRFKESKIDQLVDDINQLGFGLTMGLQTRIMGRAHMLRKSAQVGNLYVNRDMIGAVVGVQPFGGMGLSGTGPKAGGPHYLGRFMTEKTFTDNITAAGGNVKLLNLGGE